MFYESLSNIRVLVGQHNTLTIFVFCQSQGQSTPTPVTSGMQKSDNASYRKMWDWKTTVKHTSCFIVGFSYLLRPDFSIRLMFSSFFYFVFFYFEIQKLVLTLFICPTFLLTKTLMINSSYKYLVQATKRTQFL